MSKLRLTLSMPCSAVELAQIAEFAATHNAESWTSDPWKITCEIDLNALIGQVDATEPEAEDSSTVDTAPDLPEPDQVDYQDEREPEIVHPGEPCDIPAETISANIPGLTVKDRIRRTLAAHGGSWVGSAADLATEAHPTNPASCVQSIRDLERSGELDVERDGRMVKCIRLVGKRHDRSGPIDIDAARARAAAAI